MDQAISWTRLGQPGRWTSMELMSMLIILEQNQQYLDEDSGKAWVTSHENQHRPVAQRMLDAVFAFNVSGKRSIQVNDVNAVSAWKSWWMQIPPIEMGSSPLVHLHNVSSSKAQAMVEGWYLRMSTSKKMSKTLLTNMQHAVHGFPTRQAWTAFTDTLSTVAVRNSDVVWKDKKAQAWLLHKAMLPKSVLDCLLAMDDNRVHEYLTIRQSLDATCTIVDCYSEWCHMQAYLLPALEISTLFDEAYMKNTH